MITEVYFRLSKSLPWNLYIRYYGKESAKRVAKICRFLKSLGYYCYIERSCYETQHILNSRNPRQEAKLLRR